MIPIASNAPSLPGDKRKRWQQWLIAVTVVIGLLTTAFDILAEVTPGDAAKGFSAHGAVSYYQHAPKSNVTNLLSSADFDVSFNATSKLYLITTTVKNPNGQYDVEQCGTDGTNAFWKSKLLSTNGELILTEGTVDEYYFPSKAPEYIQALWLTFVVDRLPMADRTNALLASRNLEFFRINKSIVFDPRIIQVETHPYTNDDKLLRSIRYYNPGYTLSPENKRMPLPSPNEHGFILASLEKGEIVHQEAKLPMSAVFTIYLQDHYITNRDDVPPLNWEVISVHSVEPYIQSASFVPSIPSDTPVKDYRFSQELNGSAVFYKVEGNQWLSKDSAQFREFLKNAKALAVPPKKHVSRMWVVTTLLLLAAFPLLIFLSRKPEETHNHEQVRSDENGSAKTPAI
jgi:hypothetical protein